MGLTAEQQEALLRFLGKRTPVDIVIANPGAHFVRVPGEVAMKLGLSHTLPGTRTVRYGVSGQTIFVADVRAR